MFKHIKEEFAVIQERDPSIKSPMEVILYPSFKVMISYRRAHKLYLKGHYFWARWISQRAARRTGIEIHPGATIGKGFFIMVPASSSERLRSLEIMSPYTRELPWVEPVRRQASVIRLWRIMSWSVPEPRSSVPLL